MTDPIPEGQEGLIPHLVCDPCGEAIEFYRRAFDAEEVGRVTQPGSGKIMHAALTIDGRALYLCDDFPEFCAEGKARSPRALGGSPVTVHRYVRDCDAAVERARQAGATVQMPPEDMFWGDRYAQVVDPFGHSWSLATHVREVDPDEMTQAMAGMAPDHDG
ncbi:Glyoxalase/bleomycin resistance protein/dioxygenase [Salinisphaera sp. PC39]|uniref:VOC family protein n=1 Tax=Salinisphaera sp. PC39 TaxID=1304156 RepID=UPI003340F6CF